MDIVKSNTVEERIIVVRDMPVLLDSDVAEIYGVETKRINEAVSNNPEKFPDNYILALSSEEHISLRSKFSTLNTGGRGQHTKYLPKAFTEQGLYMLATILKSEKATQTTIEIIETFTRIRQFSRTVKQIAQEPDKEKQKPLMKRAGELIGDILDNDLPISETETSFELNLAMLKIKHTTKRKKKE